MHLVDRELLVFRFDDLVFSSHAERKLSVLFDFFLQMLYALLMGTFQLLLDLETELFEILRWREFLLQVLERASFHF